MRDRVLRWLACPICQSSLRREDARGRTGENHETIACEQGHIFPIVCGVPRLLASQRHEADASARSIHESFSREWEHFDYDADRTWGQTVEQRKQDFLRHVNMSAESLADKTVLDAGCGNGMLSVAISGFGCEVVATDISGSVEAAYRHFSGNGDERTHFIQSDLMASALKRYAFDVVYCAGVLHHTPDTRRTFESLVPALAPGGTIFVWLYWRVPGAKARVGEFVRRMISPLPVPLKHAVVWALVPQSVIRNRIRAAKGKAKRLNSREIMVRMLDSYTPRYRCLHTPEELQAWYREHGFTDIQTTEEGVEGFGVAARRPPASSAKS